MIRLPECPICGRSVVPASDPNGKLAPFCSQRCKAVDLFRWSEGRYAIVESIDPERLAKELENDFLVDETDDRESMESE